MNQDDVAAKNYLETIYNRCNNDIQQQVSMYEAGAAIGLEKNEAGSLAEDLMVQGLLELKTLAGEVSLTEEGMSFLGISLPAAAVQQDGLQKFSSQPVMQEADLSLTKQLIEDIKQSVGSQQLEFALTEEIVLDIKTIDIQLLSPRPKTAIIREVFGSIQASLSEAEITRLSEKIAHCIQLP